MAKTMSESKKARMGAAASAIVLGLITQGLPVIWAAGIIGAIAVAEIAAWAYQEKGQ